MMLFFAVVALVFTVATLGCAVICMVNFGRGLKMVNKRKGGDGGGNAREELLKSREGDAFARISLD